MCREISTSVDDLQLLQAWRGGDRRAAGALYQRHAPEVRRYFKRTDPEYGADLVQETFMALLRASTSEPASVRRYVMAIAYNVLCRHLRRKYKQRQERGDYVEACVFATAGEWTPAVAVEQQERQAALAAAFGQLSRDERRLLTMRYSEALSVGETARRLGISLTAFPGRAQRAKRRLRDGLPEELRAA